MIAPAPIDQVARMLNARAFELCRELLPAGYRDGNEYRVGNLAGQPAGKNGGSMSVHLYGEKAGIWADFNPAEGDRHGDALDLVAWVKFGGSRKRAFAWALSWLGLDNRDPRRLADTRYAAARLETECKADADRVERYRRSAMQRYLEAERELAGTPVDKYLLGRAIDLRRLPRNPGAIRFHPRLACVEVGRPLPAMVAAIHSTAGKMVGIHRTWLEQRDDGRWIKARLKEPKKTLGRYQSEGGCIRLWRGASATKLAEAPPDDIVIVTEGIEDGLTMACAEPAWRVIAAVSLGNVVNLRLPEQLKHIVFMAQNDDGDDAKANLRRGLNHLIRRHGIVRVAEVPQGFKDVNDVAQHNERVLAARFREVTDPAADCNGLPTPAVESHDPAGSVAAPMQSERSA
jgi:hypothetical protein